jgi:uncharacterized protein DUF732
MSTNNAAKLVALAAIWAIFQISSTLEICPVAADPTVQTLEPSRPSTPALDEQFLADLAKARIRISDAPLAIYGAHDTCAYLAAGRTAEQAVVQGMRNNSTMTRTDEIAFVDAAIGVYCPRYLGLPGTLA